MSTKLGKNIKSLRQFFGETQEELGFVLDTSKSAVANYESGSRYPSQETLERMASHYLISIEELLYMDISANSNGFYSFDHVALQKRFDIVFPYIDNPNALENIHFQKALLKHKELYKKYAEQDLSWIEENFEDYLIFCGEEYSTALEECPNSIEAMINTICILTMLADSMASVQILLQKPAHLDHLGKHVQAVLTDNEPQLVATTTSFFKELIDEEFVNEYREYLCKIKESVKWSSLADYYLAYSIMCNIVDNDLSPNINRRFGAELMSAFQSLGNPYATNYLNLL